MLLDEREFVVKIDYTVDFLVNLVALDLVNSLQPVESTNIKELETDLLELV